MDWDFELEPDYGDETWTIKPDAVLHVTEKAFLVRCGETEAWLPKSLVSVEGAYMVMPMWLAEEKGLDLDHGLDEIDDIPF